MSTNNSASLIVKLEGGNTIEANTLINMLTHYVAITERANALIGEGSYKSEVKVKALQEGSFEISLEIACTWLQNLITRENISFASEVVGGIVSVMYLYRHFKGRRISRDEAQQILKTSTQSALYSAVKIYNDHAVRETFRQSIETAKSDPNVDGITLVANGVPSETIREEEFGDLVIPPSETTIGERSVTDSKAILSIISLSFNRGDNWRFIYKGNKIVTKLSDDGLQRAIDQGASFAKGDALEVELEIVQKWNREYKAYINNRYKVVNVINHIHAPTQQELFSDNIEQGE